MKSRYPRYGNRTAELERSLNAEDRQILRRFLDYCLVTASPRRVETKYKAMLLQFQDVVEKPFSEITSDDAIRFWGLVNSAPYEERTKIDIKSAVKRFLKWQFRDLQMLEPLKIPRQQVNRERLNKTVLFTEDEIRLMLHRAERLRDKALFVLLYESAARPQEVRDLRWRHVNWAEQEVHFYSTKTGRDRDLPLREAMNHLKRWRDEWVFPDPRADDFIFPSVRGSKYLRDKPLSVTYINRIVKMLARKAQISRPVHTYVLRHTRLTELRRKGVQGTEWKLFAGHTPGSKMEETYLHLDNDDMKTTIISKVYNAAALPQPEKARYETRIELLEAQLREVLTFVQEARHYATTGQSVQPKKRSS